MTNSNSHPPSSSSSSSSPSQQESGGQANGGGNPFDPFKVALIQLNSQEDVQMNIKHCSELIRKATADGAQLIVTPENTGKMSAQFRFTDTCGETETSEFEYQHVPLREYRKLCQELQVHLLIGSLAVRVRGNDKRVANRSYLLVPNNQSTLALSSQPQYNSLDIPRRSTPGGSRQSSRQSSDAVEPEIQAEVHASLATIAARYTKIHMFDIEALSETENYSESKRFQAGNAAVACDTRFGRLGLSICYDLRFPHLYRALSQAGCSFIAVPSAFTKTTGSAHWHVLLRSRAIENGCYILAAGQGGKHPGGRETYGHSLVVAPWGDIVGELNDDKPGYLVVDVDPKKVAEARKRIPAWHTNQPFTLSSVIKASVHPNQPPMSNCPPAVPRMSRGVTGVNTEVTATTRKPHLTVYHNPTCSKCKELLNILSEKSHLANWSVIDYMQHQFSREELYHIIDLLQLDDSNVQELLRDEAEEVESIEEAVNVLTHQPQLIQRPIVIDESRRKAQICRPPGLIMELLDPNHP